MAFFQKMSIRQYEWWFGTLLILAGAIVGIAFGTLFTIILGAGVGGIASGFAPLLLSKKNISTSGLWIIFSALTASIFVSLTMLISTEANISTTVLIIEGIVISSIVSGISRLIYQKWVEHKSKWWLWVIGSLLILTILGASSLLFLITALSSKSM